MFGSFVRRFSPRLEALDGRNLPGVWMAGEVCETFVTRNPVLLAHPIRNADPIVPRGSKPGGTTDGVHVSFNLTCRDGSQAGSKPGGAGDGVTP
jgi:hypothetical protein